MLSLPPCGRVSVPVLRLELRKRRRESASKSWRNPRHTPPRASRLATSHAHIQAFWYVCTYYYVLTVCLTDDTNMITIDALYNNFNYLVTWRSPYVYRLSTNKGTNKNIRPTTLFYSNSFYLHEQILVFFNKNNFCDSSFEKIKTYFFC